MRASLWLPPVLWMATIMILASDRGSAEHTSRFLLPLLHALFPGASADQLRILHAIVRKAGHLTEYGILARLWIRALLPQARMTWWRAAGMAFTIAVAWAILDEAYQTTQPSRAGSPVDVAIDAVGALLAVAASRLSAAGRACRASRRRTG